MLRYIYTQHTNIHGLCVQDLDMRSTDKLTQTTWSQQCSKRFPRDRQIAELSAKYLSKRNQYDQPADVSSPLDSGPRWTQLHWRWRRLLDGQDATESRLEETKLHVLINSKIKYCLVLYILALQQHPAGVLLWFHGGSSPDFQCSSPKCRERAAWPNRPRCIRRHQKSNSASRGS